MFFSTKIPIAFGFRFSRRFLHSVSHLKSPLFRSHKITKETIYNPTHSYVPRNSASDGEEDDERTITIIIFFGGFTLMMIGLNNWIVPAFRRFCKLSYSPDYIKRALDSVGIVPDPTRKIRLRFGTTVSQKLDWEFEPEQPYIEIIVGEPALAFFKVKNIGKESQVGIATYSLDPPTAGEYVYKIQCFCFEEQRLDPGDEVLMPIFFYIDPSFDEIGENLATREVNLTYHFRMSINNEFVNKEVEEFKEQLQNSHLTENVNHKANPSDS